MTTLHPTANLPPATSAAPVARPGYASALLAGGLLLVLVVVHGPAFLCLGLDSDITNYDLLARGVLQGQVLYRDALEPNLPGIVWLHVAIRSVLGWESAALRAVDLLFVAGIAWLLGRWLTGSEGSRADVQGVAPSLARRVSESRSLARRVSVGTGARLGLVAVVLAFYFTTTEWCHCQRDTWMLLPALVGLELRRGQLRRLSLPESSRRAIAGWALAEGAVWAAAFWIKPFVAVPAIACWLVAAWQARRAARTTAGRLALDGFAFLAGGAAVGAAGVAWLIVTGAWPGFVEVMFVWNREYFAHDMYAGQGWLPVLGLCARFFPWVLVHLFALPLAIRQLFFARGRTGGDAMKLPAAFYLAWLSQAVFLQHLFDYVHVPALVLAIALVASRGLSAARPAAKSAAMASLGICLALSLPSLTVERAGAWMECLREGSTPELRDRLTLLSRVDWTDLEEMEKFLRRQEVAPGEVTCFSLPTVPIYLDLDLSPSTRYVFLQDHLVIYARHRPKIHAALAASPQRFVVCDLSRFGMERMRAFLDGGPERVPPAAYPWASRIVHRSGNYVVFAVAGREMPQWLAFHFDL
ncbi:MAG: hypothetical protein HYS13_06420 [Planctomycetia bacterium]|nr:hypothetical protein [Planctomycetia bacterium]